MASNWAAMTGSLSSSAKSRPLERSWLTGGQPSIGPGSIQEGRHPVVILDAAQADPGQEDGIGQVILVIGLVHVPDEGHMQRRGHGRLCYRTGGIGNQPAQATRLPVGRSWGRAIL